MILNISRLKSFMICPRYAYNRYIRNLATPKSMNLTDGSAFHKGVAVGQATNDWTHALTEARRTFETDVQSSNILPDEDYLIDFHWAIVETCIQRFADAWQTQPIQVLQPECEFLIPFPGIKHYDITLHHLEGDIEKWGYPDANAVLERRIFKPLHAELSCPCYQPHRLAGRTDGIIRWQGHLWLQEHKTTSIEGDKFWSQWHMDLQITAYMYGVWKATGLLPKGVILNSLYKPSENQVAEWQKRTTKGRKKDYQEYIRYSYEVFTRTQADLLRFEQEFPKWCDEWERRLLTGWWPMSNVPSHCISYNRKCDYWNLCLNHDAPDMLDNYTTREPDYIDQHLIQITGTTNELTIP